MDTTHQQEGGDTQNPNIAEGIEPQVAVQETPENLNNNHETKNFVEDKADQNNVEESKVFHVPLSESNDDPDENYQPTNTPFIENGVPIGSERPPMNYVDYILQRTQMGPFVKDIPTQILDCLKEDNLDQLQKMNFKKNTPPDENQQNNDHKEPENNHASSQGEGESGADSEKQDSPMDVEIDPSCIFRKGDGTGRYLIHAAIIYSAYDCLNYLFSLIQNWDDVFIDASWELDSYTFLHICAFTLFYHSEASELPKSAEVGQNKKRVNTQKAVKIMELLLTNSKFSTTFELNAKDRLGCTVLHYLAMCPIPEVVDLFKICTEKGADYEFKDRELNAPIHIAIKYHNPECFKFLVSKYNAKLFEVEDFHGYNLITVCIQEFSWECLTELVKVCGPQALENNDINADCTPSAFAQKCGFGEIYEKWNLARMANEEIDWKDIYKFHQSKTMLFFCKTSYQHADFNSEYRSKDYQKETQVENSDRVRAVMKPPFGIIHRNSLSNASIIRGAFPARLGDITRVHDANYIKKIKDKCEEIEDGDITDFDPDTSMSRETWEASINSSGSCLEAARRIMRKEGKNAFCCIRPPGHHAGLYGKAEVDIEELEHVQNTLECESIARPHCTNGFCFVNNACITAAYLKTFYPDEIQKVAIIDFDVHHGNGTEQIVECLNPKSVTFETYNQYFGACKFKKNLYKPWCDENDFKNILFVSTHSYEISPGKNFYPGSGSTFKNTNPGDPSYPGGILNIPFQESSYSMTWRMNYLQQVLPRLFEFKPDFILISAGFDGHCKDLLGEISPLSLTEFDYAWLTKELVKISNTLCEGRIISMLEGGYNTTGEGLYSPLANSIFYHFLELSHNYGQKYIDPDQEFLNRKRRYENMSCAAPTYEPPYMSRRLRRRAPAPTEEVKEVEVQPSESQPPDIVVDNAQIESKVGDVIQNEIHGNEDTDKEQAPEGQ